ncbi:MAG: ureidoglycolate lyase [Acidobacteria bacterium]|nr:MAG: ureidoglycolate lyase [Acidobacteriota bacterium]REK05914.1 MAG: ureidoglycolate lyase [Acidobacteriota bacterium]
MNEPNAAARSLAPRRLTPEAFAPFGDVIAARGDSESINQGTSQKFSDLAQVELDQGDRASLHLYRATATPLPTELRLLERHPLGSQAFVPLDRTRFLVVVAEIPDGGESRPTAGTLRAFVTDGRQGIQLRRGVWHHPLLSLEAGEYLIVDRWCETPRESERNLELLPIDPWRVEVSEPA